ncbi:MAG: hypothetical protein M3Z48_12100, partial [Lactobacillus sp.]|nr:hypothetical protein [Lactobacillus sp.]
ERPTEEQQKALYHALREDPAIAGEEFANFKLTEKELFKHTLIIPHALDYQEFANGKIVQKNGYLLTYFRHGQAPYFATIYSN